MSRNQKLLIIGIAILAVAVVLIAWQLMGSRRPPGAPVGGAVDQQQPEPAEPPPATGGHRVAPGADG